MNRRDFKVIATQCRAWASRWDDAARRGGAGVRAAIEARYLSVEYGARAELAERYAQRAAVIEAGATPCELGCNAFCAVKAPRFHGVV